MNPTRSISQTWLTQGTSGQPQALVSPTQVTCLANCTSPNLGYRGNFHISWLSLEQESIFSKISGRSVGSPSSECLCATCYTDCTLPLIFPLGSARLSSGTVATPQQTEKAGREFQVEGTGMNKMKETQGIQRKAYSECRCMGTAAEQRLEQGSDEERP